MKFNRKTSLLILAIALMTMASSCASHRPPYKHHKPRRSGGCDCSRWSYIVPENILDLYASQTNPPGRA